MPREATQFKPGRSGNPGGRPKGEGELRDLARVYTYEAVSTLVEIMRSGKGRERALAASILLDRGWGKPAQSLEHTLLAVQKVVPVINITGEDEPVKPLLGLGASR